jgi:hypothetical protein
MAAIDAERFLGEAAHAAEAAHAGSAARKHEPPQEPARA